MRLLHIHSGNLYGGIETLLATLARHRNLCRSMTPEFALCFDERISEELAATGAVVHHVGAVRMRNPISMYRARQRMWEVLKDGRFDFAVSHSSWSHVIFGPIARRARVPEVRWLHDTYNRWQWLDRWASLIAPDVIVANSRFTANTWSGIYPDVNRRVVLYPVEPTRPANGFDRMALRQKFGSSEDAVVIVQLSRMEQWKGQTILLRALGLLREDSSWLCWIVGGAQRPSEQRYLSSLKDLATDLGIADRVRFAGQRRDSADLLAAADIHCQPNLGPEPFGITFVEALFSGLPVVTSGFGGAVEVVSEKCGVLVPPNDPERLASALRSLIADRRRRETLGAAGPSHAASLCDSRARMQELSRFLAGATPARPLSTNVGN